MAGPASSPGCAQIYASGRSRRIVGAPMALAASVLARRWGISSGMAPPAPCPLLGPCVTYTRGMKAKARHGRHHDSLGSSQACTKFFMAAAISATCLSKKWGHAKCPQEQRNLGLTRSFHVRPRHACTAPGRYSAGGWPKWNPLPPDLVLHAHQRARGLAIGTKAARIRDGSGLVPVGLGHIQAQFGA